MTERTRCDPYTATGFLCVDMGKDYKGLGQSPGMLITFSNHKQLLRKYYFSFVGGDRRRLATMVMSAVSRVSLERKNEKNLKRP